jgi:hypothetical protein
MGETVSELDFGAGEWAVSLVISQNFVKAICTLREKVYLLFFLLSGWYLYQTFHHCGKHLKKITLREKGFASVHCQRALLFLGYGKAE